MTAIAAIAHEGKVYMASDSAVTYGSYRQCDPLGKVWTDRYEILVGCAGATKALNAIRLGFDFPAPAGMESSIGPDYYMRFRLPKALRPFLQENAPEVLEKDSGLKLQMIIGCKGRIWTLDDDFCVTQNDLPYDAIGSGREYALGALTTTQQQPNNPTPEERLRHALQVAAMFDNTVSEPFHFIKER